MRFARTAVLACALAFAVSGSPAASASDDSTALTSTSVSTAVPGVAPPGSDLTAVYLDSNGQVMSMSTSQSTQGTDTALFGCTPVSGRDNPHRSSTGFAVSGHGSWDRGSCSNSRADVLNCLYEFYTDGSYRQKACSAVVELSPGGGSGNRTTARRDCNDAGKTTWRNHVNVDVKGEIDSNEVPYNQADVYCRVY